VQVARRRAGLAGVALTLGPQHHAVIDARRDGEGQVALALDGPAAAAGLARVADHRARAAAGAAGLLHAEDDLLDDDHAVAVAALALGRLTAGPRAAA